MVMETMVRVVWRLDRSLVAVVRVVWRQDRSLVAVVRVVWRLDRSLVAVVRVVWRQVTCGCGESGMETGHLWLW